MQKKNEKCGMLLKIISGHRNVAEWLVNHGGADVNIESCNGTTPLELSKQAGKHNRIYSSVLYCTKMEFKILFTRYGTSTM